MRSRTFHTGLVEVTSQNSGGRAKVLYAHPALTTDFTDSSLTSKRFEAIEVGKRVEVRVVLTEHEYSGELSARRHVTRTTPYAGDLSGWMAAKADDLLDEAERYDRDGLNPKAKGHRDFDADLVEPEPTPPPSVEAPKPTISTDGWDKRIYIQPTDEQVLEAMRTISDSKHVSALMIGPSGYGKSSIPQQKAKDWGMQFLRWDCATVRDPEEFFGFRGAQDGSTMDENGKTLFTPSLFTEAIERGNTVVVLDELNRIDPYISNILFPLLDHAGKTNVAGHEIKVGPNVMFFASINMGYQFTGTFQLDQALVNRFAIKILVGALPSGTEKRVLNARTGLDAAECDRVVRIMTKLRKLNESGTLSLDASTRVSLQVAELIATGLPFELAFQYVVLNGLEDDEIKEAIDVIRTS